MKWLLAALALVGILSAPSLLRSSPASHPHTVVAQSDAR
jgi:hypothetical protein